MRGWIGNARFMVGLSAGIFLSLGVIVGLIVASNGGWFPWWHSDSASRSSSTLRMAEVNAAPPQEQGFVGVAKSATPAVVNISTTRVIKGPSGAPMTPFFEDPFFRQFFGDEFNRQFDVPRERREQSAQAGSPQASARPGLHRWL